MIQSLAYPDYWAFASTLLLGLALVHLRLLRKSNRKWISGADWILVLCGLTYGWLAIDHAVKWQDDRIGEVIQRLLVPLNTQFAEEGARENVVLDGRILTSRIASFERGAPGTAGAGGESGVLVIESSDSPSERLAEGRGREDGLGGAPGDQLAPIPDAGKIRRSVLDVDYVNRKKAVALTAMQSMATAVVVALFLAVVGVVFYLRVRDDHLRSEIESARALGESEKRFRLLYKGSPDAILVTDLDGSICDVNPAACDLLQLGLDQLTGLNLIDLVDREHQQHAVERMKKLAAGEIVCIKDTCFTTSEGKQIPVEVRARKIDYPNNPACLVHVHDLTDRIALEYELRQAQKMEGIGQLAAGVAHDFNNLLTVIQGHSLLLLENRSGKRRFLKSLHEVVSAAERAAELTAHLLTFSRKQQMHLEFLDANDVLDRFLRLLGRVIPEHIDVVVKKAAKLPSIRADRGMIEQVITNLMVNARDAMPAGGSLTLSTSTKEISDEEGFGRPKEKPGKYVVINIEDTGEGMDEATRNRIFEPFFTTKDVGKGTGLGLASAYGIVAQHGGWIRVESILGKGTTLSIFLPAREEPSTLANAVPDAEGEVRGGTETILIVEDEPALRELVALNLKHFGYEVIQAASGREALLIWKEVKEEVDLLLTDLVMPEGVSGRELGRQIGSENGKLPIVYMSGYSGSVTGFGDDNDFDRPILRKPYTPAALARAIRTSLDAA